MLCWESWSDWMVIDMANPFVAAIAEDNETTQELDEFQEYAWDFEHDTFRYDAAGNHIIVTKNEAIKVWIYKLLKTERYRHIAYYDDYGLELEKYVGKVPNDGISSSAVYADIKEAVLVNPYILAVNNVRFSKEGKKLTIQMEYETVYGTDKVRLEV